MELKTRQLKVKVERLQKLQLDIFLIRFVSGYLAKKSHPGQFLHLKINSVILRRPFSIHRVDGDKISILFRVRGRGTKALSQIKKGAFLNIIGPLGQGFNYHSPFTIHHSQILVAGGIGVAPLVFLAQKLSKTSSLVLLGAKNKKEILCESEFKKLGFTVKVATDDGSKGSVVEVLKNILRTTHDARRTTIYACGPKEMFFEIAKVLKKYPKINCQVSFEQFMGCGLGICCACVIETKQGYKKACKDGPVFNIKDIR